jgi:capsular exopolysaccharide synthesis family protein
MPTESPPEKKESEPRPADGTASGITTLAQGTFFIPTAAPESPAESSGGESIDLRRYVEAIRKRALWIVALAVVAGAVAVVYTMRQPRLFRAEASLILNTATPKVLTDVQDVMPTGGGSFWGHQGFYRTEYKVMASRAVARLAAEKMGLEPPQSNPNADLANQVHGKWTVAPDRDSRVVRIRVVDTEPEYAARLANAVVEAYIEQNMEKRLVGTRDAASWLAVQHQELKRKLEDSEDKLHQYMLDNNILNASLESQMEEVKQRLNQFIGRLADIQAQQIAKTVDAEALAKVKEDQLVMDSMGSLQGSSVVASLKSQILTMEADLEVLQERYQPAHPKIKNLQEKKAFLEKTLEYEIEARLMALNREQESLAFTEKGLGAAIAQERTREAELNKLNLDYQRLKREVSTNASLYEMVTSRMKETDLTGMMRFNNVMPFEAARVPRAPFSPNLNKNLLLALAFALAFGIAVSIGLDLLDTRLKTHEDVEHWLKSTFLGILPILEPSRAKRQGGTGPPPSGDDQARDLFVLAHPKSAAAECSRAIRTNLLFMSPDEPLKTLAVTSASPDEGKTTTAISLAITMAQAGSRTLLVDTDMRRPRLHKSFGLPAEKGLSTVVLGEDQLDDAIKSTDLPDLDVLVCGPIPPNPAELLHTQRFSGVIEELKARYDRVIFDSPPVGAVTDPVVLSAQTDGAILVVKAEQTKREAARQALRTLGDAKVHVLGVILNDVDLEARAYSGYAARYYRYGGYYGDNAGEAEAPTSA